MVLDRIAHELSESYEDFKESVRDTRDAVIYGNDDPVDFDRRKAIVSAGSLIAGWEGLKRVPDGAGWMAAQSPYEIRRKDSPRNSRNPTGTPTKTEEPTNTEDSTEEPIFNGRSISDMLDSEGSLTKSSFSDYVCSVESRSNIDDYEVVNAYNGRDVRFAIEGKEITVRGDSPGFSASKDFEEYMVEHHKKGTLDDRLEEYWESMCR